MVGSLFCPICKILPVSFNYTMFPRLCYFRLTTVFENCHSDTLHNISRHKFAIVFYKMACVKSVLWPALVSNVVDVSLSGGSLGYWTACNNVKRYCTVPYCDIDQIIKPNINQFINRSITCDCRTVNFTYRYCNSLYNFFQFPRCICLLCQFQL